MFVGIDVSKDLLDVHLRPGGESFAVGRDDAGLTGLVERLLGLTPSLIVLEATGGYETVVASALAASPPATRSGQSASDPGLRKGHQAVSVSTT